MDVTWSTLIIILAGILVVVGGVLVLKLHAFLALTLGALVVAVMTPSLAIQRHALSKLAVKFQVQPVAHDSAAPNKPESASVDVMLDNDRPAGTLDVVRFDTDRQQFVQIGMLRLAQPGKRGAFIASAESSVGIRSSDLVVPPQGLQQARNLASQTVGQRIATGFGGTCAKIGILIAMASIIGKCLLDSGAADRIVRALLGRLGEDRAPLAFLSSGFLLGVPVFFDTVFYLMIPLGKAMRMRTGRNYLLYVLSIVAGATMAHSLVPPTPGPLLVASELGVDIGLMILVGGMVGLFTVAFGYVYAVFASRIWDLPLRDSADLSLEELETISRRDERELPPTWAALLPILLPVVLIGGYTILKRVPLELSDTMMHTAATLGDKNIALVISAVCAMAMLVKTQARSMRDLASAVQPALSSGGVIILITAAGGAFGQVLQQTNVAGLMSDLPTVSPAMIIIFAFLITAAIRTAQGSATVAMITAVGILSGLAPDLPFHPVYLAVAIGCGSKPIGWMNDSGFWVITKMSGMTETEGLKYVTPMTSCMGLVGLVVTLAAVRLVPMSP